MSPTLTFQTLPLLLLLSTTALAADPAPTSENFYDPKTIQEIRQFADRLLAKMLHPPLESLRDESRNGSPHGLIEALQRLFQLKDTDE